MTGRDPLRKIFISSRDTRTINLFNSLELWSPCYRYLSRKKKKKKENARIGFGKRKKEKKEENRDILERQAGRTAGYLRNRLDQPSSETQPVDTSRLTHVRRQWWMTRWNDNALSMYSVSLYTSSSSSPSPWGGQQASKQASQRSLVHTSGTLG